MFNTEYTITWDEIAPSLQLLFKSLQAQIVDNHKKIMKNRSDLDGLDKRIFALENTDPFLNLWLTGQQGQVVKIDKKNKKLYPHDEMLTLRVVDTQNDLDKMKKEKPDFIKTLRDEWVGYAHYNTRAVMDLDSVNFDNTLQEGQNLNGLPYTNYTNKGIAWTVDDKGNISCSFKSPIIGGYRDPKSIYHDFTLEYQISVDNTSGMIGLLLGYLTDQDGTQHTLSLIRGPLNDYSNSKLSFSLIYDLGNPTQEILSDHSLEITDAVTTSEDVTMYANLKVEKVGTLFKISTTPFDTNKANLTTYTNFDYEFNITKSDFKKETSMNILKMINNPTPIGVLVRNTTSTFKLLSQRGILDNDDIYDLKERKHYTYDYDKNVWKEEGRISDYLSNRIFLYNKKTRKFFFHYYPGVYMELDLFQSRIFENAEDGQVIKLDKSTNRAIPDNEFHLLCGYLTAADKSYLQDNMLAGRLPREPLYDFPTGKILEYVSGSWKVTGDIKDKLRAKTLVYNKALKKLFFYKEDGLNGNNVVYVEF